MNAKKACNFSGNVSQTESSIESGYIQLHLREKYGDCIALSPSL